MTTIGELRHRITFQSLTRTPDGVGGSTEAWANFATVWAAIDPISASERYFAEKLNMTVTHKIRIRKLAGLSAEMRIEFGARIFQVKSFRADLERKDFMTVLADEGVAS